jgi:hypothetical protein
MIQNALTRTNCFKFIDESGSSLSYYNVDITVNEFYDICILYYDIYHLLIKLMKMKNINNQFIHFSDL